MCLKPKAPTAAEIRIAVALTALLLFLPVIGIATRPELQKADFQVLYTGGLILRAGNAARLYDLSEQQRVQEGFMHREGLLPDPYPPFHALLFAPLTLLGYRAAYLAWGAMNVFFWVVFQAVTWSELQGKIQPFRFLMLSASFFPLWLALMEGQTSVLLLLAFALAFLYLRRERDYAAGFALGLGLLKFQIVLPFALVFLLRRKWRFIVGLAAATALLAVISIAVVGPSGASSYVHLLLDAMLHPSNPVYAAIRPWNMPTVRGFVTAVLRGGVSQQWITAMAALLSGGLILLTAKRWDRQERHAKGDRSDELMFAAALVVALLSAPYLYVHDLTLMLAAVVLVVGSVRWSSRSQAQLVLALSILVLYSSPLYLSGLMISLVDRQQLYILVPLLLGFALASLTVACDSQQSLTGGKPS